MSLWQGSKSHQKQLLEAHRKPTGAANVATTQEQRDFRNMTDKEYACKQFQQFQTAQMTSSSYTATLFQPSNSTACLTSSSPHTWVINSKV